MFVDDIISEADVCSDGYVEADGGGKDTDVFVWEVAFEDFVSDGFA